MIRKRPYTPNCKMADLISEHYRILLLIFRFEIPLGMGEKTIKEVCEENDVELNTFLQIVHLILFGQGKGSLQNHEEVHLPLVMKFLKNSHGYFLNYRLPAIQKELMEVISGASEEIIFVIQKYLDEYVSEVFQHMRYEDEVVFPYVEKLLEGELDPKYSIDIFEQRHDKVEFKMLELKNILIKYLSMEPNYEVNMILHELFSCGDELRDHNDVEDYLFIPCVKSIESALRK